MFTFVYVYSIAVRAFKILSKHCIGFEPLYIHEIAGSAFMCKIIALYEKSLAVKPGNVYAL